MKFIHGLVFCALFVASCQSTPFNNCAEGPPPSRLKVEGCDQQPCKLYRGTNATAEMDFTVGSDTTILKTEVLATSMGITIPYPLPQKDGCTTLKRNKCPISAGSESTYVLSMPVLKIYPKVAVLLQFSLRDQNDKVVLCFKLDTKVADK